MLAEEGAAEAAAELADKVWLLGHRRRLEQLVVDDQRDLKQYKSAWCWGRGRYLGVARADHAAVVDVGAADDGLRVVDDEQLAVDVDELRLRHARQPVERPQTAHRHVARRILH